MATEVIASGNVCTRCPRKDSEGFPKSNAGNSLKCPADELISAIFDFNSFLKSHSSDRDGYLFPQIIYNIKKILIDYSRFAQAVGCKTSTKYQEVLKSFLLSTKPLIEKVQTSSLYEKNSQFKKQLDELVKLIEVAKTNSGLVEKK